MSRIVKIKHSRLHNFLAFQRDPLQFLLDQIYEGEVVSLETGVGQAAYVVNSPEFIKAILVTHEKDMRKGRSSKVLQRTVGEGLLTSEHEQHRQQRKYMQPAFYKERINEYAHVVVSETEAFLSQLTEGTTIDVHKEMMKLTLNIITKTMFSVSVENQKEELAEAVDVTIEQSAKTLFSPIILPMGVPTKGNRNHKKAIATLEKMIYSTLAEAKQRREEDQPSMLRMLLDTRDENGQPITDQEIRDQMMTMLLAGHETTATALTWVFYLLSIHPDIRNKVIEEAQQHQGTFQMQSLARLPYMKQVIDETLRLYPPAWIVLRELERPLNILGESFPKNSSFMISPYAIHRRGDVFEDPLTFKPERFGEGHSYEMFQYFPFGGGPRGCIGSRFAIMEAVLILACISQRVTFHHEEKEIIPEPLVSLRVKGGLRAKVERIK